MSKKVGYLKAFCRGGRIILANSSELNELIKDKKDYFMILPFFINTEDVQIREIDVEELKNLLPNSILTSPYEPKFDDIKSKNEQPFYMNSKPFSLKKLEEGIKKLNDVISDNFISMFGL